MLKFMLPCLCLILCGRIVVGEELCLPQPGAPVALGGFLTTRGGWPGEQTVALISYTAEGLQVQVDGTVRAGGEVRRACQQDDDFALFSDELVEIFLLPDRWRRDGRDWPNRDRTYLHLAYNLNGKGYTARNRDISWNPSGIICRGELTASGWTLHLQIPWPAIDAAMPPPDAVWRLNVARTRQGQGVPAEVASWSGSSDFHDAEQMGRLRFGQETALPMVILREVSTMTPQITALVHVDGAVPAGVRLQMLADGVELAAAEVPADERPALVRLSAPVVGGELPLKDDRPITFRLSLPGIEHPLWEKTGRRQADWQNLLELDRYFYHSRDRMLRYRLNPATVPDLTVDGDVELQIFGERPLPRFSRRRISSRALAGELPLGGLSAGAWLLRATFSSQGQTFFTYRAFRMDTEEPAVNALPSGRLRTERERLLIGNQPVFLLGASPTPKTFLHENACFNLAIANYGLQPDAVKAPILPGQKFVRRDGWVGYHYAEWEKLRAGWQETIRNAPAEQPLLYRVAYEAAMRAASLNADGSLTEHRPAEWYARVYRELKRISPQSLFSLHSDQPDNLRELADSCDVFQVACWQSSYASFMLSRLDSDMQQVRQTIARKPVLFWLGGTVPDPHCRSGEELLAAAALAVAHDLNGVVIHMGHGFLPEDRSRVWSVISNLDREVQAVFALYQKGGRPVPADLANGQHFRLAARRRGRVTTLIAVNLDGISNNLNFSGEDKITLPLLNQTLSSNADFFAPYEAKIYLITSP